MVRVVLLSVFNHNLLHYRRTVYAIVNMQVIDAIGQIGHVELNCVALGCGTSQQVTLTVVQEEIVSVALIVLRRFLSDFNGEYIGNRIRVNRYATITGTLIMVVARRWRRRRSHIRNIAAPVIKTIDRDTYVLRSRSCSAAI